jgi:hypothetical protein
MKKVKVMLASIAVLAVIGGAVAFKAKNMSGGSLYTFPGNQTPGTGNACATENDNVTTTTTQPTGGSLVYYTVSSAPAPCFTLTKFYTISNE